MAEEHKELDELKEKEENGEGEEPSEGPDAGTEFTVVDSAEDDAEEQAEHAAEDQAEHAAEDQAEHAAEDQAENDADEEEKKPEETEAKEEENTNHSHTEEPMETGEDTILIESDGDEDGKHSSASDDAEKQLKDKQDQDFLDKEFSEMQKMRRMRTLAIFPVEPEDLTSTALKEIMQKSSKTNWQVKEELMLADGKLRGVLDITFKNMQDLEEAEKAIGALGLEHTHRGDPAFSIDSWLTGLDVGFKVFARPSERMILIHDLPKSVTEEQLQEEFPGAVVCIPLTTSKKRRGYGLLEFPDRQQCLAVLADKSKVEIDDCKLRLEDVMMSNVVPMETGAMFKKVATVVALRWDIARNWKELSRTERISLIRKIYKEEFQLLLDEQVKTARGLRKATLWVRELQKRLSQRKGSTGSNTDHFLLMSTAELLRKAQVLESKKSQKDKKVSSSHSSSKNKDSSKSPNRSSASKRSSTTRSQDGDDKRRRQESDSRRSRHDSDRDRERARDHRRRRSPDRGARREHRRDYPAHRADVSQRDKPVSLLGMPPVRRAGQNTGAGIGYGDGGMARQGMAMGMADNMGMAGMQAGGIMAGGMDGGIGMAGGMAGGMGGVMGGGMGAGAGKVSANALNLLVSLSQLLGNQEASRQQQQQQQQQQATYQQQSGYRDDNFQGGSYGGQGYR